MLFTVDSCRKLL